MRYYRVIEYVIGMWSKERLDPKTVFPRLCHLEFAKSDPEDTSNLDLDGADNPHLQFQQMATQLGVPLQQGGRRGPLHGKTRRR